MKTSATNNPQITNRANAYSNVTVQTKEDNSQQASLYPPSFITESAPIQKKDLISHRFKNHPQLEDILDGKATIQKGSSGLQVRIIQQALLDAGFQLPKFGVDGDFGEETITAIIAFQKSKGLSENGIVNQTTIDELDKTFNTYQTEHSMIVGKSDADVLSNTRAIVNEEKVGVEDALNTEVKANSRTGLPPVFNQKVGGQDYEVELKRITEAVLLRQYNSLGKGKEDLRKDPANLHDTKDINSLAKVSKNETDKVFGGIKSGNPLTFGINIFDGWEKKENDLKGKPNPEQDFIKNRWANWRVRKIIQGPATSKLDQTHGAKQSRAPEAAIIQKVTNELVTQYKDELVQTHLGWPGFASDGKIFLQRFKSSDNDKNRNYMWDNFGTIIHEYIHTLEHNDSKQYSHSLDDKKGGKALREGVTDYFTKIVWNNINLSDIQLRQDVEGPFFDKTKSNIASNNFYKESTNAEKAAGIVGLNNLMASFFLGKVNLIGG